MYLCWLNSTLSWVKWVLKIPAKVFHLYSANIGLISPSNEENLGGENRFRWAPPRISNFLCDTNHRCLFKILKILKINEVISLPQECISEQCEHGVLQHLYWPLQYQSAIGQIYTTLYFQGKFSLAPKP